MLWIVWSGWPHSHAGPSLKFHLWRWCDVLAWRVWILLSTGHSFWGRSKSRSSSVGSLTSSLWAMLLSVQRLLWHLHQLKTNFLSFLAFQRTSGWNVRQDWDPLYWCWFQCTADYLHQCFQDSVQVFCVAALCPNKIAVFCCIVHKSKASI